MYGNRNPLSARIGAALAFFGTACTTHAATIEGLSAPDVIPGSYVVRFAERDPADATAFATAAQSIAASYGAKVDGLYELTLNGAIMSLDGKSAERLANDPRVASVSANRAPALFAQHSPIWNLDRIDVQPLAYDYQYVFPSDAAAGIDVFVIDSGVRASHEEFIGRVGESVSFAPPDSLPRDPGDETPSSVLPPFIDGGKGHGTQVAGVIAGTQWGLAKLATIHSVKIFNAYRATTPTGFFDAVEWVKTHANPPAVVNMSLGFHEVFPAAEAATQSLIDRGLVVVAAAGNSSSDACGFSPARMPAVITVGATDEFDERVTFSNFGPCVDLMAPGIGVQAARPDGDTGAVVIAGTSFAAPHVSGAVALFLSQNPGATPAQVQNALVANKGHADVLSTKFLVPKPPVAPTGLRTKTMPCGDNEITWNPVPEANWYELWESPRSSFAGATFVGFSDTPVTTSYFPLIRHVKTRACNSKGCGPFQASAVPTKATSTCG